MQIIYLAKIKYYLVSNEKNNNNNDKSEIFLKNLKNPLLCSQYLKHLAF